MSDASDLGRQARRREATRKRLLAAAVSVFEREGLEGATIARITQEADVGFGTFYLYFKSKEDLFEAVLREGFTELGNEVQETLQQATLSSTDWREMVGVLVAAYYEFAIRRRALFAIMFAGRDVDVGAQGMPESDTLRQLHQARRNPGGPGLGRELQDRFAQQLTLWLRVAQQEGRIDTHYIPEVVAISVVAALTRSCVWWLRHRETGAAPVLSQDAVIATMTRFIISALEGPHH